MQLTGKAGSDGDFILKSQKVGTEAGFRNVSQHWLNTGCKSYEQVMNDITNNRSEIEDFRIPIKDVQFGINEGNEFIVSYEGREYKPTGFALGHIAGLAGLSSMDFEILAGLKPDSNKRIRHSAADRKTLIMMIQTSINYIDHNKIFLLRTQKDGTLRAWLSDQYQIFDNLWYLECLMDIIPGGVISHWKDDGDYSTLWGNILIPDTIREESDSDYGGLISIGNSEIGRRRMHARPSLFRAICMNGCIWGETRGTSFVQVHRGKNIDLVNLRNQMREHIHEQIPLVSSVIDDLLKTRNIGWDGASAKPMFAALGERYKLTKAVNTDILRAWREQAEYEPSFRGDDKLRRSAFGMINAVSRSAQNMKTKDPSDWVKRDEMAGSLLAYNPDKWRSLSSRAKTMTGDEVENAFVLTLD